MPLPYFIWKRGEVMRPKVTSRMEDEILAPKLRPKSPGKVEIERREKAQAELMVILDSMERIDAFIDDKHDFVMCKKCSMPCLESGHTRYRKAFQDAGGGVICSDCLCSPK